MPRTAASCASRSAYVGVEATTVAPKSMIWRTRASVDLRAAGHVQHADLLHRVVQSPEADERAVTERDVRRCPTGRTPHPQIAYAHISAIHAQSLRESSARSGPRPVVPDVVCTRIAPSGPIAGSSPYGGAAACDSIHSSRVSSGTRRRSSSERS